MKKIVFQENPIDIDSIAAGTGSVGDGAVLLFIGRPRNSSEEGRVEYLSYELFESMAKKELSVIVDDAFSKWPITDCFVVHRFGRVNLHEASIVIAVSSPHREEGFLAVKYIIDTIKKTVPIWKTEHFSDGTSKVYDRS